MFRIRVLEIKGFRSGWRFWGSTSANGSINQYIEHRLNLGLSGALIKLAPLCLMSN
jgi:hypothetical protein